MVTMRFNLKSYLETHRRTKRVMDILFICWFAAICISSVLGMYGLNIMKLYIPDTYSGGFNYGWIPIIFGVIFTIPVMLLYTSGGFCGVKEKPKDGWSERHYKIAEQSAKMFKDNKQGDEIDI